MSEPTPDNFDQSTNIGGKSSAERSGWTLKEAGGFVWRGVLMGGADIVPGVSGGTVALVVGVYERLVEAVSRVDGHLVGLVKKRDVRAAANYLDLRLLIPLGLGIAIGIVALGSVMHTLLEEHLTLTLATFFGLIAASTVFVARLVPRWSFDAFAAFFVGAVFAYWLVGLPGLQDPPDGLWYLFVCGSIGICAMILPGVSGAFLLLILGVYSDITGLIKRVVGEILDSVKGVLSGDFGALLAIDIGADAMAQIAVFGAGVVVGILLFSKLLKKLLKAAPSVTLALLCGLMLGSLRKLWPFQNELTAGQDLKFKEREFEAIPISELPIDGSFWMAVGLAVSGAALVFALDYFAGAREEHQIDDLADQHEVTS